MLKINVTEYFSQLVYIMECMSDGNIVYRYDFSEPMLAGPEEDSHYITICQLYEEVNDEYEDEGVHILLSMEFELSNFEVEQWNGAISLGHMCDCDDILFGLEDHIWNSPLYFILGRFLQQYQDFEIEQLDESHYTEYTEAVLKTYEAYCDIECVNGYTGGYCRQMN